MGILTYFCEPGYKKALKDTEGQTQERRIEAMRKVRRRHSGLNAVAELFTDIAIVAGGLYTTYELLKQGDYAWHVSGHITVGYAGTKIVTRINDFILGKKAIREWMSPRKEIVDDFDQYSSKEEIEQTASKRLTGAGGTLLAGVGVELVQQFGIVPGARNWDGFTRTLASGLVANAASAVHDSYDDVDAEVYEDYVEKVKDEEYDAYLSEEIRMAEAKLSKPSA